VSPYLTHIFFTCSAATHGTNHRYHHHHHHHHLSIIVRPPSPKPLPVSFGAAKRFVSSKDERPPVGIYETRMSWGKGSPSRTPGSAAFKSKTKRLDPASNKKIPGPGDYEIGSKNKGRVIRATPPSFGSGSIRFENIKGHLSPGPGSYGDGGQALTAKKTYNVTIDM